MSNCPGRLDSSGWCRTCGTGHESAEEMATRREITRQQLRLMDKMRREGKL